MNTFRKFLANEIGLSLTDTLKGIKVKEYYDLYVESINWSKDKINAYQVKKIKEVLKYSYKKSPFYKKRIDDSGLDIDNFKYTDQLINIPPLTRSDLQNNLDDIISKDYNLKECSKGSSSGSTGHPVIYYHDKTGTAANKASVLFSKFLGGYIPGDKWLNVWGNPTAVNIEWKKPGSRLKKYFLNEFRFPAYTLNEKNQLNKLYDLFKQKNPSFVYGYTNAVFLFAKYLEERNERLTYINGVFTTAENLHDYQREKIRDFIGPVYDHYGCSEINGIAAQTKFDNYYAILDTHVYLEFGDKVDNKSDSRKIIVTDLYNKVLPFIRYENGDLAVPYDGNNSSPDLNFSRFISVDGRVSDIITLPGGGNLVVPSFFGSRMLKNIDGVKQYQVQKKKDKILINLVTDDNFKPEYKKIILSTLDEYIPSEIMYELVFNEKIIYSGNGKFKLFVDNSSD